LVKEGPNGKYRPALLKQGKGERPQLLWKERGIPSTDSRRRRGKGKRERDGKAFRLRRQ